MYNYVQRSTCTTMKGKCLIRVPTQSLSNPTCIRAIHGLTRILQFDYRSPLLANKTTKQLGLRAKADQTRLKASMLCVFILWLCVCVCVSTIFISPPLDLKGTYLEVGNLHAHHVGCGQLVESAQKNRVHGPVAVHVELSQRTRGAESAHSQTHDWSRTRMPRQRHGGNSC